jgi:hypothetical protein
MIQDDITVGDFSGPSGCDRFVIMALTAAKALQLVFAGLCPETPSPVSFGHLNGFHRERLDRIDLLLIIKWNRRVFVCLNDAALCGIGRAGWENEQQCRQNPPETIF